MGITLTGKRVQNTYDSLLKLSSNDNLTSTPQLVGDGLGNDSPIYLSETKVGIGVSPSFQFQTSDAAKIGGNLTVAGNLIVNGTTAQVDSTIVEIGDNMIELAKDNVANTMDIGWYGTIVDSGTKYVGMYYDASSDLINPTFYIGYGTTEPSSTASWTTKGKLVIGALESTGGTFTGQVTVPVTPVADYNVASKKYVDDQIGGVDKARRVTITVKNTETVALSAGTVVHAHPTAPVPSGNLVQIKKADYDTASLMPAIGILNEDLDAAGGNNDEGEAIMFGFINGIDTSSFSAGDELYVGNDGSLTNSKPLLTTQLIQKIAVVMKVDASNGSIEVFGAGRSNDVPNEVDRDLSIAGNLKVDDYIEIEADSGYGRLEIGGPDGGYIDLKTPFSDDYDLRIITNSSGSEFTGSGDFNINAGNTLTLTLDGSTRNATFAKNILTTDGLLDLNISSEGKYFEGGSGNLRKLSITSGTNISAHALHTFNIASSNGKYEFDVNGTTQFSLNSSSATFAGDLTVNGGDIILGGTGRIQGIDTITDGTDAVNKNYVDNNTVDGSGTANDVAMWLDSDTLTDAPIAISGNDATFAGDIYGNLIELQGYGFKGGEGDVLDDSDFNESGVGNTFRWVHKDSSTSGTTWQKVADVTLDSFLPNGCSMDVKVILPNDENGNSASQETLFYSVSFRGADSDTVSYGDAIVYGPDDGKLRVYKSATRTYELQARTEDNDRSIIVEYTITSKYNAKVILTESITAGTTSGGTAYTATQNNNNKTKFAGELDFLGVTIGDDLRVNGILYLGAGADTTYGGYLTNKGAANEGISMKVRDDDGFEIYQVWGNAGESSLSFEAVDEAVKLYYSGSEKLKTTTNGIEVTGTGIFSGNVETTDGILEIYKYTNTSGTSTGTTLLSLTNNVGTSIAAGDLNQQKTFIDFNLLDGNDNEYPQVRIGAEVGQNGDADSQVKEGAGAFVVYTNNATGSGPGSPTGLAERFRVDYEGKGTFTNDLQVSGNITSSTSGGNHGIKVITANDAEAFIILGDPEDNSMGGIAYNNATNSLDIDCNNAVALSFDSSQNATFAGNVILGSSTSGETQLTLFTQAESDTIINYRESTLNYGFTTMYDATANLFRIKRHDNSVTGVTVMSMPRTVSEIYSHADLIPEADSTYDLGSTTKYWANVYADNIAVGNKLNAPVTIQGTSTGLLKLYQDTNGNGAAIEFSDLATTQEQKGYLTYRHSNSQSQNSGESFHFTGTETDISIVAGDGTQVGKFIASAGSTAETAFSFYNDPDTGMYSGGGNAVGLVAGGSRKLNVNSNGVTINNGNLYVPEYIYHDGDTNTYIRFVSDDRILIQNGQSSNIDLHSNGNNYYNANEHIMYGNVTLSSTGSVGLTINADTDNVTETDVPFVSFKMDGTQERFRIGVDSNNIPYISTDSDLDLGLSIKTGTANTQRMFVNTNGNIDFTASLLPSAENLYNIGSASLRWEDLYVDDGYIRNAYIDTNIYHNGDTDTYINFTTDTIKLSTAGGFGFEQDSNRDINSPDRLYMRQTNFGYSSTYKVVQFGNAAATSGISLGYNPSLNTNGGFSGNEILIPNNIRILAPNAADNAYYGLMILDSNNKLKLGSSNYLIESNYIMAMDPATKRVGINTDSPSNTLHVLGSTRFDKASLTDPDTTSTGRYPAAHMFTYTDDTNGISIIGGQGGHTGTNLMLGQETGRSSSFKFIKGVSDTNGIDVEEFYIDGVGNAFFQSNVGINSGLTHPLNVRKDGSSGSATIVAQLTSVTSLRPTLSFSENADTGITSGMSIEYNGTGSGDTNYMSINAVDGNSAMRVYSGGTTTLYGPNPVMQVIAESEGESGMEIYDAQDFGQNGKVLWSAGTNDMTFVLNSTNRFRMYDNGDFHADGDVVAYSTSISDAKLKDNVKIIDNALEKVKQLNGVSYIWNKGSRKGKKDLGVIAQEVQKVLPEIVHEKEMRLLDGETYKTVDYEKLTAVLIESVKELSAKVEALENKKCNCNCK